MVGSIFHIWRKLIFCSLVVTTLLSLLAAHNSIQERLASKNRPKQSRLVLPAGQPSFSQDSIDRAMDLFEIDVPANVQWPTIDPDLLDRGVTIIDPMGHRTIRIGPAGFASWGILGSTLAHEVEVHGTQSFLWIKGLDRLGLDGTALAEREAYLHEIKGASRFGLSRSEVQGIRETMNFYYPSPDDDIRFSDSVSEFH